MRDKSNQIRNICDMNDDIGDDDEVQLNYINWKLEL